SNPQTQAFLLTLLQILLLPIKYFLSLLMRTNSVNKAFSLALTTRTYAVIQCKCNELPQLFQ
ncbi:hypothetical protein QP865_12395, partial [Enterococcus faecalis]|uniref:hypothetical protein n=1 Tax=Enterococcus faecalis TaxID=1351 RepID=UPI00254C7737